MVPQAGVEPTLANYLLHTGYKSAVLPLNYRGIAHPSSYLGQEGSVYKIICSSRMHDKTHSRASVKIPLAPAAIMCLNVLYHFNFTWPLPPAVSS